MSFDSRMRQLEQDVMSDIIRRISINGEITRSADWQINRLYELGVAKDDIKKTIQKALNLKDEEVEEMFRKAIESGYARNEDIYKKLGKDIVPFSENKVLQQYISSVAKQTAEEMRNLSQSLGFAVKNPDGTVSFTPIAEYYQNTLDNAINGIANGVFDYNTAIKRAVNELTKSGLRSVDYASGWSNRVDVAARRAVMTGMGQLTGKVNEMNAEELGTDMYEVSWHGGARPSHQVWQGRWYTMEQLKSVCGLGTVTGLNGANCYHDYYPVIPGISEPTYTEEELDEMNRKENTPVKYGDKEYTKYEALQRQRKLETAMRAQRQKIKLLEQGKADEDDIIAARGRYRVTSQEYSRFSKAMDLPQQRERVTVDGLGDIGKGKWKISVDKKEKSGIINKKISDRIVNIHYENKNSVFDLQKINDEMYSSNIGKDIADFIDSEYFTVYMNYDLDAPPNLMGDIIGKDITVYATNHNSETEIVETIIHEASHKKYSWDEDQEGEINCRIMEYLHSHESISNEKITEIVNFVKREYADLPKGELYGY